MPVLVRVTIAIVGLFGAFPLLIAGAHGERFAGVTLIGFGVALLLLLGALLRDLERPPAVLRAHAGLLVRGYGVMLAFGLAGSFAIETLGAAPPVATLIAAVMAAGMRQAHTALIGRPLGPTSCAASTPRSSGGRTP